MQSFEQVNRELERQGKAGKLRALAESDAGQRVSRMLDGAALSEAAQRGDAAALRDILSRVLSTEDGKQLAENVRRMLEKD